MYSFGKHLVDNVGSAVWDAPEPFAPEGYNRGRSNFDRKHILNINGVYELPFGRGRRYMTDTNALVNGVLGGWQLSGIYSFTSGSAIKHRRARCDSRQRTGHARKLAGDPYMSERNGRSMVQYGRLRCAACPSIRQFRHRNPRWAGPPCHWTPG